jgi:hypothetical protein
MRKGRRILLALLAAPMVSCATLPRDSEPAPLAGHNFAYRVPLREAVNLIQVFDDGSSTYLQFRTPPGDGVDIRREPGNHEIPYTADDAYLKVSGVYDALTVSVGNRSTSVINESAAGASVTPVPRPSPTLPLPEETPMSASPASQTITPPAGAVFLPRRESPAAERLETPPIGVPESLQTMHSDVRVLALKREIATLEERVRELTHALNAAHRAGEGGSIVSRAVRGAPRIVVTFDDNRFETRLEDHLADVLGSAARVANRIYLHGHTDAYVASQAGTELAIQRAVEVRKLLISRNVEPERIRLFYRGAGNFIANNSTPEGKALNRRVEIEMRQW